MTGTLPLDFASARRTDPETSHLAAADAQTRTKIGRRHQQVLELLAPWPATDFELAAAARVQQTSIGKRRGECCDHGLVRPCYRDGRPVRRPSPSGSLAQVWEITEAGRAQLAAWQAEVAALPA